MEAQVQRRRWIPAAVLAVGLLSTALVSWQMWQAHEEREEERFSRRVLETRAAIAQRLATCVAMLRATAGLFAASDYVEASEFHEFVDRLELDTAYPGIRGIGFSQRAATRAELEDRIEREQGFRVAIHPAGERPEYHAIVYLEPLLESNRPVIGYDMSTESERRRAMERACDTGEAAASALVPLFLEVGRTRASSFVVYHPLYKGGDLPAALADRRAQLLGYVHAPISLEVLVSTLYPNGPPPVEFVIHDVDPDGGAQTLLYETAGFAAVSERAKRRGHDTISIIDIAGRTWKLHAAPGPVFEAGDVVGIGPFLSGAGVLISFLLFGLVRAQTIATERSERTAQELRESEARKSAILESAIDPIITVDHHGRIVEWNAAAERTFGWAAPEAIGKTLIGLLMPESVRSSHREEMEQYLLTGTGAIVGRRIETTASHATSRTLPVEVSICRVGNDEPRRFTGFIRDITERVRIERHQALMTRELDHRVKNNLATVIAILSESARRSGSVETLVRNATGRIRALAGLHEMLAARKWQGAELGELVARTLAPYMADGRRRVILDGDSVTLPDRAASSVCMALHELATNASKYGSLSAADGTVHVSWRLEKRGEHGPWLILNWEEHGGPSVHQPQQRGFGSELIEDGVAFETGGNSVLTFRAEGVACTIEIPCAPPSPQDNGVVRS